MQGTLRFDTLAGPGADGNHADKVAVIDVPDAGRPEVVAFVE
jgi:hypothetical protein